jgi:hypothetical protein
MSHSSFQPVNRNINLVELNRITCGELNCDCVNCYELRITNCFIRIRVFPDRVVFSVPSLRFQETIQLNPSNSSISPFVLIPNYPWKNE